MSETSNGNKVVLALAWMAVGLPLLWGVAQTVGKAAALFH
jgi:hypothetical protein